MPHIRSNSDPRLSRRALLFASAAVAGLASQPASAGIFDRIRDGIGTIRGENSDGAYNSSLIAMGLREALSVGAERTVDRVGKRNGYRNDPNIYISLPSFLRNVQNLARPVGMSGMLDDLEVQLNRAAEKAAPKALSIFSDAIASITLNDANEILNGADDAATQYFKQAMTPHLMIEFRPIVTETLQSSGAIQTFDRFVAGYSRIPLAPELAGNAKEQLVEHTLSGALNGIFYYLAQEEKEIRRNPAKRTTELLRKVFGSGQG